MIPRCLILPVFLCALNLARANQTGGRRNKLRAARADGQRSSMTRPQLSRRRTLYIFAPGRHPHQVVADLIHWENGDPVFRQPPAWTTKYVPRSKAPPGAESCG